MTMNTKTETNYECGHKMGECSCFDCAVPECDNFKENEADGYCKEHKTALRCLQCRVLIPEPMPKQRFCGQVCFDRFMRGGGWQ